jgi:hypothetical protein
MPNQLTPRQSVNKAFLKIKPIKSDIEGFKQSLSVLLENIRDEESEEHQKNLLTDFFRKAHYGDDYFINTKGRTDLVIHNGKTAKDAVGVMIEVKRTTNSSEMLTEKNINTKALQELVLYFLRERISNKNVELKHIIATNIKDWFIFDANVFEKCFAQDKKLVKLFEEFLLEGKDTAFFYNEIAKQFIEKHKEQLTYTYFNIDEYGKIAKRKSDREDSKLIPLYKLLSVEHLLKKPFLNDGNTLNKNFYTELLHLIGLEETKVGTKKLIERKKDDARNSGSLLELAIALIRSRGKLYELDNPHHFGKTADEQTSNVALELVITWINRILFLKLLEAQLIKYHKGDKSFAFLNIEKIKTFSELDALFFQVLAVGNGERDASVSKEFANVPYLNSSLFEQTSLESATVTVTHLSDGAKLPILSNTVLKDELGVKKSGELGTLSYLFEFLNAYDFTSEGGEEIQEDNKALINASVLGLIFEKINGYKDGSYFTPSFVTMYMCKQAISKAVINKFNEVNGTSYTELVDIYNTIDDVKKANEIINSIKICDPAVGSGHFLVSALNEIIYIKSYLGILRDKEGKSLRDYTIEVVNDELIVTNSDGEFVEYHPKNKESQRIQETLFEEKQAIIENCLFGVDINANSVKICRLRLWIELLKNAYYKENDELETLPNIDINIKVGDSLISRFALDIDLKEALKQSKLSVSQYRKAVESYKNAHSKDEKRKLEKLIRDIKQNFKAEILNTDARYIKARTLELQLLAIRGQDNLFDLDESQIKAKEAKQLKLELDAKAARDAIAQIENNKIFEDAFEWRFEIPEVLNDDGEYIGFDVVIGNPPYLISFDNEQKEYLEGSIEEFKRNNDLYVAFYIQALRLLKKNGQFSFITPNTFIKGTYFNKLREYISKNYQILEIIDFGNFEVFSDVSVFCAISFIQKSPPTSGWVLKEGMDAVAGFIDVGATEFIIKSLLISQLDALPKLEQYFDIKDVGFNYWTEGRGKVRGESIGSRVLYKGDKLDDADTPYIKGGNINKYSITQPTNYLRHNWKSFLTEDDTFRFSADFFNKTEKIVYRQTSDKLVAALDCTQFATDKTVHIIVPKAGTNLNLKYLLGLLNSKLFNYYFSWFKKEEGKAFAQVKTVDIKRLPFICKFEDEMVDLVSKIILESDLLSPTAIELQSSIDNLVYKMFDLTADEIALIEGA